ncbi:MAG: outer membrane protein assembly factor BamD [Deltaproteobacteria bacterium]|nr:outer membrane protein assembly factor BamD [Deltaproteobacteria bacterium]
MYKTCIRLQIFSICLLYLFFLSACASIEEDKSPEEYMEQGTRQMDRGSYEAASESFQNLKDRYPYSKYALIAELRMADALYLSSEYDLAFDAYDEFEKLHPKDKNIPYVIYQKGMCNFEQMTTIDREQRHTHKAKAEFERLVKRFPDSRYAERAIPHIRKCFIFLAEHEFYVGHYYYKTAKYQAALARFTYLITNYPDMGQHYEALEYIRLCREKLVMDGDIPPDETMEDPE